MKLPIDTNGMTFLAAGAAEPVVDFDSKTAKVDETVIEFSAGGPEVSEFHVTKPSGWPKGDYKLTLYRVDHEALDREGIEWKGAQELIVLTVGLAHGMQRNDRGRGAHPLRRRRAPFARVAVPIRRPTRSR